MGMIKFLQIYWVSSIQRKHFYKPSDRAFKWASHSFLRKFYVWLYFKRTTILLLIPSIIGTNYIIFKINQEKSFSMSDQLFNFSNLDFLNYDAFESDFAYQGQKMIGLSSKDPNCIFTQAPTDQMMNPTSRSKKTCLNPFESSFQCNFHYEHIEACDKKTQNFMEAISSCSEKIQKQELKNRILQNQTSVSGSHEQILDSQHCQIDENQKLKFKVDLRFEKKLREFLDQICKKFVPEVAGQLLAIADLIWLSYTKVMEQRMTQSQLINWAKNLAEKKFNEYIKLLQRTKEICFREDETEVFPNFGEAVKQFMNFYFVTIVLVIEQCFENPFFQEEGEDSKSFKRASSQGDCYSFDQFSELQQDIYGSKRIKF